MNSLDLFFEENKEIIYSYRPYVISGEDYYFIIKAVYEGLKFSTQSEFLEFKQKNISQKNEIKKNSQKLSESDKRNINKMINKLSIREITTLVGSSRKISKKEIYNYCLKLKNEK